MITEIVEDYLMLQKNVDRLIELSGHPMDDMIEKLGMDKTSFEAKRKEQSFTPEELEKLFTIIKLEELEDKVLGEMSIIAEKEKETIRLYE